MRTPFLQTASHYISGPIPANFFAKLPKTIQNHTGWEYSFQPKSDGCFLSPTFNNMPYRNSFVPEISITASHHDTQTMLHITGRPVKLIRVFMAVWFGILLLIEAFLLILAITSNLDNMIPAYIPIAMCVFGYLLCALSTKAAFISVIKAIEIECA